MEWYAVSRDEITMDTEKGRKRREAREEPAMPLSSSYHVFSVG